MSNMWEMFETNEDYEQNGVWIDFDSFRFLIARAGGNNKKYRQVIARLARPYQQQIKEHTLSEEKAQYIEIQAFVKGILKGWEGVSDRDGNPIEFNEKAALELFQVLPDLFRFLQNEAESIENYKKVQEVEEEKK